MKKPRPVAPPTVPQEDGPSPEAPSDARFPIVTLGASAGGLAAFEEFFGAWQAEPDMAAAFVVVQHLSPDHPSVLADLIKRVTWLSVFEVTDGVVIRPNCVYVIPPNYDLAALNGGLQLLEPVAARGQRMAIDYFFRSLAQDQGDRVIAIILSGTGSDGTMGIRAVKAEGGMVMTQEPTSAAFDGMPRSAIATGMTDFVLPPAEMPREILAFLRHESSRPASVLVESLQGKRVILQKVFVLLRSHTGHDFSQYKASTIARRVARRMAVHRVQAEEDYVRILQQNPIEVEALFLDLLIGVTSFFRDPEAFAALEASVIPRLFADKPAGAVVRVWVAGCSTGEEAYSIAILLIEHLEASNRSIKLQVFATDIDRRAIDCARAGIYPVSIASDITADRLNRFFTLEADGSHYRIQKRVRDVLVFSEQSLVRDPPFSKLHLVSCRNVLIYLGGELQKKVMPLFDYALVPGGYLFLGTSESVGDFGHLFTTIDRKAKLYQSRDDGHTRLALGGRFSQTRRAGGGEAMPPPPQKRPRPSEPLRELTERALLQHRSVAGALIDGFGNILYLHGRTGQYLELASGQVETNILKMAREGLKHPLSVALRRAIAGSRSEHHAGLSVRTNASVTTIDLTVRPVPSGLDGKSSFYLVILEEVGARRPATGGEGAAAPAADPANLTDPRIEELKRELVVKEESLQTSNEELETSNEELKSSNEEMQSVNEELQSANEEMETSKEELQSVNEELSTVNIELQTRVTDLSQANNDMNNLLAGTGVGTIFIGHGLQIKRFTPSITPMINLIPTDIGRSVGHLASNLVGYDRLVDDVQKVLDTLVSVEVEVQAKDARWFLLRIRPYRTLENMIEGAVITLTDVSAMKQAQEALTRSSTFERLAAMVRDAQDAITVQDRDGRILAWNPGAVRLYGWSESEALTMNVRDLIPESDRAAALDTLWDLSRADVLEPYRSRRATKAGRTVEVSLTATSLVNEAGEVYAIATTERVIN